MNTLKRFFFAMLALLGVAVPSFAQTNTYPDPSVLYTNVGSAFNTALTWTIGAIAVLLVIGWILRAMRGRK